MSIKSQLIQNLWEWIPETRTFNTFPKWLFRELKSEKPALDLGSRQMELFLVLSCTPTAAPAQDLRPEGVSQTCIFQSVLSFLMLRIWFAQKVVFQNKTPTHILVTEVFV